MPQLILLYDPASEVKVQEKILPALAKQQPSLHPWSADELPNWPEGTRLVTYLPDAVLYQVIPQIIAKKWVLGLLPHPEMIELAKGFKVRASLEKALAELNFTAEPLAVDQLYCNDKLVFNAVSIGDPFGLRASSKTESLASRWRRFKLLLGSLNKVRLRSFTLTTEKEKTLETAALGMVAVDRGDASAFARRVVDEVQANDCQLNLLILSPRSLIQAFSFLIASVFLGFLGVNRLPKYLGVIKSSAVKIEAGQPVTYIVDGQKYKSDTIQLRVDAGVLNLLNGLLDTKDLANQGSGKESFRVKGLPTGEARRELVAYPLPWIHHAGTDEFKDLFLVLKENAKTSEVYLTLMVLATLLALIGLFANSAPVIIGAMILAPLMSPIISFSMGALRQDEQLIIESGRSLVLGVGLALFCATLMTWLIPLWSINEQIAARLSPTLLDLGVAIISGIAGAYAHSRAEVAKSLAGVAIAVALVPPLAVAGIGIGWLDWAVFWGAFLLFLTNLAGIVLAAALTFMVLGFSPFKLARRGLIISLLVVVLVSIPLASSFIRMVNEHGITSRLEGQVFANAELQDVQVKPGETLLVSARLLTADPLNLVELDLIKQAIELELEQPIRLEATLVLVR